MDAGFRRMWCTLATLVLVLGTSCTALHAADFRTQNFIIMAPNAGLAQAVGQSAEAYRRDLAIHWLGRELPPWPSPCPIRVIAGNMPAQGVTQYNRAPVRDFQMEVVGTPERILDSVLPHEVTHTILATHFGRPLPRWADEGICTTVEHISERQKHEEKLREFLRTRRGIAMNKLFLLTEYPSDVLPMYAQGYSVCQFLIAQRGSQQFVQFLGDYMQRPSWTENIRRHYGYESLAELQEQWLAWVAGGNGPVDRFAKVNLNVPANGQPTGGDIALAAATDKRPDANRAVAKTGDLAMGDSGSVRVAASVSPDGWYQRLRREAQASDVNSHVASANNSASPAKAASSVRALTTPPSIYSAAQPQPEQGATSTGQSVYPAGPNFDPLAAPQTVWR